MGEIRLDILFTGRLSSAAYTIAAQLISGGYNVVFASDDINEDALGKKITPFRISPSDKDFERIFSSYNFGAAVYIAQSIYRKEPYYGEYQDLEAVLRISCEHEIPRVVCVSPKYQSTENGIAEHDLAVMFSACDMLCDFYR